MSDYTKATNFTTKDTLPTGNANKIVKGTEIDTEFTAIASAITSKADSYSPTLTGVPLAPTAAAGTNNTQLATTAYTDTAISTERTATTTITNKTITSPTITGGTITGITDLVVADGGTGVSTIPANAVVLGNGTSAIQTVAPSTSGNVLTSNGTTWTSTAPAVTGIAGIGGQAFTSNGTFTIPSGVTLLKVTVTGGGGGATNVSSSGGAGGAGGTAIKYLTGVTPAATLAVTIGSGGSSAAGGNSTVASGTQTISTITGNGGGYFTSTNAVSNNGALGGSASGGTINITGGDGSSVFYDTTDAIGVGGQGGASFWGGGGRGAVSGVAPENGKAYGSGGGGGFGSQGSTSGAVGVVLFEW